MLSLIPFVIALLSLSVKGQTVNFDIDATKGNKTQYKICTFVENNVNRADDGGLYAELIQNRAFQESTTYLTIPGWTQVGSSLAIQQDPTTALGAIKQSLQVWVPKNATAAKAGVREGVQNSGWWGIPISPQAYNFSFWIKDSISIPLSSSVHVSLSSLTTNETFASVSFPASSIKSHSWTKLSATLHPNGTAPDSNNVLSILFNVLPDKANGAWINLVSLFPPTFKDRPNGMRKDIAQTLADLKPKYVRIPGGSNMQGSSIANRYNWSNTIGPLENRPGRLGYWVGYQTEGFGLFEMLQMVEDFNASTVLGIYDGYSASDESIPDTDQLDFFIQDSINELHFAVGDAKTNAFAKKRADLGHPAPFSISLVEIGNEDETSKTYNYRYPRYLAALQKEFPQLKFLATSTLPGVPVDFVDLHDFSGPDFFYAKFNKYDSWPRNTTKIIELEGGVISTDSVNPFADPAQRLLWSTLQAAVAESVVAIGLQRNGDLVIGSSYAPNLANVQASQWTPNLISFNASNVVLSTSYHVQRMVSSAGSDTTHPITTNAAIDPLYWVASSAGNSNFFLQIANINQTAIPMTGSITLPTSFVSTGKTLNASVETLTSTNLTAANSIDDPTQCVPSTTALSASVSGGKVTFSGSIPGWSFSVLKFSFV